jgi:hypothetical protein
MTLAEWAERSKYAPRKHASGAYHVPQVEPEDSQRLLWHLTDYLVSSVTGGSIWLVPRVQQ